MNVVIVTGEQPHHRFLCAQIARTHAVTAVLHPVGSGSSLFSKLRRVRRRLSNLGPAWTIWNLIGQVGRRRLEQGLAAAESPERGGGGLGETEREYGALKAERRIHHVVDFRAASTMHALKRAEPHVVICLGGPVYPREFIEACPLVLNYHSGISPIYNGTSTIWFAFANGHPQWCGGTLMTMSATVDGGDILGHYLPRIDAGDHPQSLFIKTATGAVTLYLRFLDHLQDRGTQFSRVRQPHPLFYFRSTDWTPTHTLNVKRHLRRETCAGFRRAERVEEHWRQSDNDAACVSLEKMITGLLWSGS